jgi:hypothetical protein
MSLLLSLLALSVFLVKTKAPSRMLPAGRFELNFVARD